MKKNLQLIITAVVFLLFGLFLSNILFPGKPGSGKELPCHTASPFKAFLHEFNDDLMFQQNHTYFPLLYVARDLEDDEKASAYLIERSQWVPLSVFDTLPAVIQIEYDTFSSGEPDFCTRKVTVEGIQHGQKMVLRFLFSDGRWMLETFEDHSF